MRGIQLVSVSPSGAAAESDDIVRDLENWFADHQQMCRLMSVSNASDLHEAESNLDRLRASADSGHRLFSMLKSSYNRGVVPTVQVHRSSSSIPLSGMNRFDDNRSQTSASSGANQVSAPVRSASAPASVGFSAMQVIQPAAATEQQSVLPSRTYLKKSGS